MREEPTLREAPEVEEIARRLIPLHHHHLEDASIRYLFRDPARTSRGMTVWGRAVLADEYLAHFADADFVLEVGEDVWHELDEARREALVDHELLHMALSPRGDWTIRPHDVEEFEDIAARHGAWRNSLRDLVAATTMAGLGGREERPVRLLPPLHETTAWRPRLSQRKGIYWITARYWRSETRRLGIRMLKEAKDGPDPGAVELIAGDLLDLYREVVPAFRGVISAPAPRHSAFIGVPHLASIVAERISKATGNEYAALFETAAADRKGHHPAREKEPPKVIAGRELEGVPVLLVDDIATSGATMELHAKALKEKGALVQGLVWCFGSTTGAGKEREESGPPRFSQPDGPA